MVRNIVVRASVVFGFALATGLSLFVLHGPQRASACSIVLPTDARFADWVARSPIVAIGTWEAESAREVTLAVEQPIKGVDRGQRLAVDNRTTYTAVACSPYDEPFREGYRFVPGERAVVLLEKEVDGLWQVSYLSLAVFEVPESMQEPLEGVGWYFGDPEAGTPTDIRLSTIVAAAGFEGEVSLAPAPLPPREVVTQPPPNQAMLTSETIPGSDDRNWWPFVAIGAGAIGASVGTFGLRRIRR